MFTIIDGGFNFTINELVTLDFSWLFMFCSTVTMNVILTIRKFVKLCNKDNKKDDKNNVKKWR